MTVLFSIIGVIFAFFVIVMIMNLYANTPTKGKHIAKYENPKSALLVIDVQNDITKSKLYNNTSEFVERVNQSIKIAEKSGMEIIYIKNIYSPVFALLSGAGKIGTEGVEFDNKLKVVNKNIFIKSIGDGFSVSDFDNYLISKKVDTLYIVGADAAGCVVRTAQGGKNRNYDVKIIRDAVITMANERRMKKVEELYEKNGIKIITLNEIFN